MAAANRCPKHFGRWTRSLAVLSRSQGSGLVSRRGGKLGADAIDSPQKNVQVGIVGAMIADADTDADATIDQAYRGCRDALLLQRSDETPVERVGQSVVHS